MWHTVAQVAQNRRLDPASLVDFALSHEDKYGIIIEGGDAMVGTWYCNDLVNDFRRQLAEDEDVADLNLIANFEIAANVGCEYDGKVA